MCGIAGFAAARPAPPAVVRARLAAMAGLLVHRGPDEGGEHVGTHVGLASRRLRVIDLDTGRMPLSDESGEVTVVYNGEIYNHPDLRRQLEARGHRFASRSDTEVLVHLWEEEGPELVHRLVGMFAFALWDERDRTLFLARDRLGIKPLFYRWADGELSFASELKSLVRDADAEPELDPDALAEYLALGYVRAPRTIYRGYRRLPPGHRLTFRGGEPAVERYWEFPTSGPSYAGSPEDAVDELEEILATAVRDRLIADVPLGAFLSGGVDSSVVVALAAREKSSPLKTFSIGFEGADELPYARMVAERYGTDHHELRLGPEACEVGPELLAYFDEPFGDPSSVPTYFVSELARRHVTVALSGDGGDELFGGYDRYAHDARWARVDRIPGPLRRAAVAPALALLPRGARGRGLLRALASSRRERFELFCAEELDPARGGLLHPELAGRTNGSGGWFDESFGRCPDLPFPARLLYVDATNYLPDDILAKVDRMSMAHSLEARVPLLDHRVVEFAAALPPEWKIRNGERKWIFKRLARRLLPHEVLDRPKQGFSLPVGEWFRGPLSGLLDDLLRPGAAALPYLHAPTVKRLVEEHRSGRREHAYTLWRLAMLERWLSDRADAGRREEPPARAAARG